MNSKGRKRLVVVAIIILSGVFTRYVLLKPKPVEIAAYTVKPGKVEETVTNSKAGTVKVRRRAKLSPEMGGRVVFLGAREGAKVTAGQVLLRLEDSDLRASLQLAERGYQAAQSNAREACLAAEWASRELERNRSLNKQGIVSDALLDQYSNKNDVARAHCEASKSETKRAEASIAVAQANWKKTELRAPFDGVLAQLTTEVGEWITPSPPGVPIPPVLDVLDNDGVYIQAPIDETDAGKLQIGMPVRVSLDPYPDQTFEGRLTRIAPFVQDIEGQNRTVDIEAELTDNAFTKKLLPGTSSDIEVIVQSRENVLRIPTYALLEGNRVLLVDGKKLAARSVKPGLRNWEFAEILEGLKQGDRIAVSLDRAEVKEGAFVTVTNEADR